jgi:hypothetical protein
MTEPWSAGARRPGLSLKTDAWLKELVTDCDKSHRLSSWDRVFIADVALRHVQFGVGMEITDKQMQELRRIEEKIHACG